MNVSSPSTCQRVWRTCQKHLEETSQEWKLSNLNSCKYVKFKSRTSVCPGYKSTSEIMPQHDCVDQSKLLPTSSWRLLSQAKPRGLAGHKLRARINELLPKDGKSRASFRCRKSSVLVERNAKNSEATSICTSMADQFCVDDQLVCGLVFGKTDSPSEDWSIRQKTSVSSPLQDSV